MRMKADGAVSSEWDAAYRLRQNRSRILLKVQRQAHSRLRLKARVVISHFV
jgi:hypothetical protein